MASLPYVLRDSFLQRANEQGVLWTPRLTKGGPPAWWIDWRHGVLVDASGITKVLDVLGRGESSASAGTARASRSSNGMYFNPADTNRALPLGNNSRIPLSTPWTYATSFHNTSSGTTRGVFGGVVGSSNINFRPSSDTATVYKNGGATGVTLTLRPGWNSSVIRCASTTYNDGSANGDALVTATTDIIGGNAGNMYIGLASSSGFDSWIREVIAWHYFLKDDDLVRLQGYLAWNNIDVGLRSLLPLSHPYRNAPPLTGPVKPRAFLHMMGELTTPSGTSVYDTFTPNSTDASILAHVGELGTPWVKG